MTFISYAQNYEDVILWRALKHIGKGSYIDVGANDPVLDSVTKAFYDKGWRGINIEPVTAWFQKLQRERPEDINLQVAASNTSGELLFFEVVDTGLSTTSSNFAAQHAKDRGYRLEEYNVPAKTITNICREENFLEIHFLKVDVEGSETVVLEGIDFKIIRPWKVLVEATLPNTQIEDYKSWESLIIDSNYHFVYFDGLNRFYVADEHRELDTAFQMPPNYWDDFLKAKEYEASQQFQNLQGEYQQLQGQHQHLQGQYQHLQGQYQHLQGEYQSISREMYDLKHGRLWRMTALLRRAGDLERYLKKRFRQQVSKTDRLTGEEITMALRGSGLKPSQKEANEINSDFMLTPRAARILQDLKRATQKR